MTHHFWLIFRLISQWNTDFQNVWKQISLQNFSSQNLLNSRIYHLQLPLPNTGSRSCFCLTLIKQFRSLTINRLVTAIYVNDSSYDKKIKVNFIMSQKLSPITNFEIIITKEIPHLTIHIFRNFCGIFCNSTDTYMIFT